MRFIQSEIDGVITAIFARAVGKALGNIGDAIEIVVMQHHQTIVFGHHQILLHAQGADYLEQDLVMTKDDRLVVLHDHYLDRVTDVAERFPDRARKDGRYYAIDFTLDEIRSLKFTEGFELKNGKAFAISFPS